MDQEAFDQFGNYIGPQIPQPYYQKEVNYQDQNLQIVQERPVNQHRIVLNQDKKYYPLHQEIYQGAETLIQQEDTQNLETPIIKSSKQKNIYHQIQPPSIEIPPFNKFLTQKPSLIHLIAVCGSLHHGKTKLIDMLVRSQHQDILIPNCYSDNRFDQQERAISIQQTLVSLILQDNKGKSWLLHLIDTPGHTDFIGQIESALMAVDSIILVVDSLQGITIQTQRIIKLCVKYKKQMILIMNKIDRLILQLKLPPQDCYLKLRHTIQQINILIQSYSHLYPGSIKALHPLKTILFASTQYQFLFSIDSFFQRYASKQLSKMGWGDYYFNRSQKKILKKPIGMCRKRIFVQYILQPLYKIFSMSVSKEGQQLNQFLQGIQVNLDKRQLKFDIKELLITILRKYFGSVAPLVQIIVQNLQTPTAKSSCNPSEPLCIHLTKLIPRKDCKAFDAIGRVINGSIKSKQRVKIMGEGYTHEQKQDFVLGKIDNIYFSVGRYRFQVDKALPGNIYIFEGVDKHLQKTGTIVQVQSEGLPIQPIRTQNQSIIKVAIEPFVPSQLPKMLDAIRKVSKSYPNLITKVQQSGQHVLMGYGQLQFDCILHDIRNLYSDIQIKVSDPSVSLRQTIVHTSSIKCYGDTPNKKNRITILANPLQKDLDIEIQNANVKIPLNRQQKKVTRHFLEENFQWDILQANNLWAFGPSEQGPNVLINDTLPSLKTQQDRLQPVKQHIIQGFRWATRQGPLCDQPIRNVKYRLIQAQLSKLAFQLSPSQIIPTARRVCYSALLTASPRILQPILFSEIVCTSQSMSTVHSLLARRRGHAINQTPKPGTPLYIVKANIPAIDSFGFQTDLRVQTSGQAYCMSIFDKWNLLQGDPLDKSIKFKPLQPAQLHQLPREFMLKTRRRKGLNEQVSITKYFDDPKLLQGLKTNIIYNDLI